MNNHQLSRCITIHDSCHVCSKSGILKFDGMSYSKINLSLGDLRGFPMLTGCDMALTDVGVVEAGDPQGQTMI